MNYTVPYLVHITERDNAVLHILHRNKEWGGDPRSAETLSSALYLNEKRHNIL